MWTKRHFCAPGQFPHRSICIQFHEDHGCENRRLRAHWRHGIGCACRSQRLHRLALLARLLLRRMLRGAAGNRGKRALADSAGRGQIHCDAPLHPSHIGSRNHVRTRRRRGEAYRFHASKGHAFRRCAHCAVRSRNCFYANGTCIALRLWPHRALGHGYQRRRARDCRAQPRHSARIGARAWREPENRSGVHTAQGRTRLVHAHLRCIPRARSQAHRCAACAERLPAYLAQLEPAAQVQGKLSRCRRAFSHHTQGPHLSAERWHRGFPHHFVAGADRWNAETGTTVIVGCATLPSPCSP